MRLYLTSYMYKSYTNYKKLIWFTIFLSYLQCYINSYKKIVEKTLLLEILAGLPICHI